MYRSLTQTLCIRWNRNRNLSVFLQLCYYLWQRDVLSTKNFEEFCILNTRWVSFKRKIEIERYILTLFIQPRTDLYVQVALLPNILHAPITKRKLRDPTTLEANRKPKAIARSSARNSSRLWFALLWASQQRNSTRWSKHDLNTFTVYSGVYGKLLSLHRSVNVIFISLTKRLTGLESNNKTWFLT